MHLEAATIDSSIDIMQSVVMGYFSQQNSGEKSGPGWVPPPPSFGASGEERRTWVSDKGRASCWYPLP